MSDKIPDTATPTGNPDGGKPGPDAWGQLRIRERLCRGTHSSIYRARDTVLDRDIALQLFATTDTTEKQRLLDEGRTMARIRHPNIVQVMGADEHDGVVGLKMELIEGRSLHTVLQQQGPLDAAATTVIGGQLCAALAAIHAAGLPHRPIDLHNVLREPDGGVRLRGICSDIDPASIAPELDEGAEPGVPSDIFALGALLYRLATGAFPPRKNAADLPEQLRECLDKAVADDPRQRYATPAKFAKALARAGRPPPNPLRRIIGITIILSLAVLVILQWPSQYQLESTLYRVGPGDARAQLASGAMLDSGDCLALDVTPTVPMFVYVFAEDAQGQAVGLFPRAGSAAENPLPPEMTHALATMLEGARCWPIADIGALRKIHILASAEAIPEFRTRYLALPQTGPSDVAALPLIESANRFDESADVAIGVTFTSLDVRVETGEP